MTSSTAVADDPARTAAFDLIPAGGPPGRPRLVTTVIGIVVVAVIAAVTGLAIAGDGDPKPRISSLPEPATTVPAAAPSPPTTVAPDRASTYTPDAVWPETVDELDRLQVAVDQGHQRWRTDPVQVAQAYLLDRGLPAPGMGPFQATGQGAGKVEYTVAGRSGRVDLQRHLNGSIWYVAASRAATLPGVQIDRRGASIVATVQSAVDGAMAARVKRPGADWGAAQRSQVFVGGTRSFTLDVPGGPSSGVIVQLRLEGESKAGLAEIHLAQGTQGVRYSAVDAESRLQVNGLGPVRIGMTLEEARAVSGLPMVRSEGASCTGYRTDGPPTGIHFTGVEGSDRLDLVSVSEPSIATVSGIRVGSTLAEVRRTYGDRLRGSVQDGWGRFVIGIDDDPSVEQYALALLFSDGKVAGMWAGSKAVVQAKEVCA